jgi:hypothetical protein
VAAIRHEREDMVTSENMGLMSREQENMFSEMMLAFQVSLRDIPRSDNTGMRKRNNDETDRGKVSEDDQPGWVLGTRLNIFQPLMESFRQIQIKLEAFTQR